MTTPHVNLLTEMDAAADAVRRDNPELREALVDELQILFREIQASRGPELSTVERLELFKTWGFGYAARRARERDETIVELFQDMGPRVRRAARASARDEAITEIVATIDEYARANAPSKFVCPCGADPAVMTVHQPHYLAAESRALSGVGS